MKLQCLVRSCAAEHLRAHRALDDAIALRAPLQPGLAFQPQNCLRPSRYDSMLRPPQRTYPFYGTADDTSTTQRSKTGSRDPLSLV